MYQGAIASISMTTGGILGSWRFSFAILSLEKCHFVRGPCKSQEELHGEEAHADRLQKSHFWISLLFVPLITDLIHFMIVVIIMMVVDATFIQGKVLKHMQVREMRTTATLIRDIT